MKSLFTIVFALLLMLNIMGYYGIFMGLEYKNAHDLSLRLDDNRYTQDETILLKVPVAIPYHLDQTEFQRVDGEIEHEGQSFRLVKQKLANDTLYIVCIPDHQQTAIKRALSDYVKTFTDQPSQNTQAKSIPSFIKDYLPTNTSTTSIINGWSHSIAYGERNDALQSLTQQISSPPPRA